MAGWRPGSGSDGKRGPSAGSGDHEKPARRRDRPRRSDRAWTRVAAPVFPQCSLELAAGSGGAASSFLIWRRTSGAEQLDALEEGGVRHAADVHLQDLACVAEELVQVEDPVGDFVQPADEDHPAW